MISHSAIVGIDFIHKNQFLSCARNGLFVTLYNTLTILQLFCVLEELMIRKMEYFPNCRYIKEDALVLNEKG